MNEIEWIEEKVSEWRVDRHEEGDENREVEVD